LATSSINQITGTRELARKLSAMGEAAGGQALRSAVMSASLPALKAAIAAAPVGSPPYSDGSDPYPKRTYKGRLVPPGFLKANIVRRSYLSKDRRTARVRIGPTSEAFYGVNFIEFGTSKIPKRPWLEPSFRSSQSAMGDRLKQRLKQLIDKAARAK
jgi:HK97 gp10 family phage protein